MSEKSARRLLQLMLLGRTWTCVGKLFLSCEAAINVLVIFAVPAPGGTALLIASRVICRGLLCGERWCVTAGGTPTDQQFQLPR